MSRTECSATAGKPDLALCPGLPAPVLGMGVSGKAPFLCWPLSCHLGITSQAQLCGSSTTFYRVFPRFSLQFCIWLPDICRRPGRHYCHFQCTARGPCAQHAGVWRKHSQRRGLHCPHQVSGKAGRSLQRTEASEQESVTARLLPRVEFVFSDLCFSASLKGSSEMTFPGPTS